MDLEGWRAGGGLFQESHQPMLSLPRVHPSLMNPGAVSLICSFNRGLLSRYSLQRTQLGLGRSKEVRSPWRSPCRLSLPVALLSSHIPAPPYQVPITLTSGCPSSKPSFRLSQGFCVCCSISLGLHKIGSFTSCSSRIPHYYLREVPTGTLVCPYYSEFTL